MIDYMIKFIFSGAGGVSLRSSELAKTKEFKRQVDATKALFTKLNAE